MAKSKQSPHGVPFDVANQTLLDDLIMFARTEHISTHGYAERQVAYLRNELLYRLSHRGVWNG